MYILHFSKYIARIFFSQIKPQTPRLFDITYEILSVFDVKFDVSGAKFTYVVCVSTKGVITRGVAFNNTRVI